MQRYLPSLTPPPTPPLPPPQLQAGKYLRHEYISNKPDSPISLVGNMCSAFLTLPHTHSTPLPHLMPPPPPPTIFYTIEYTFHESISALESLIKF